MRPTDDTTRHAASPRDDDAEELERSVPATDDEDEPAEDVRGGGREAASSRVIDALPGSPYLWSTICVACLIASAALILNGRAEAAFVTATLGVLAWFINVRNQMRGDDASEQGEEDEKKRLRNH